MVESHSKKKKDERFVGDLADTSERLTVRTGVVSGGETHREERRVGVSRARGVKLTEERLVWSL